MAKNNIIFLRHSKLQLPYTSHAEMPLSVLSDLGTNGLNPPIDKKYISEHLNKIERHIKDLKTLYVSPSYRCQDTADMIISFLNQRAGVTLEKITLSDLDEVYFDLMKMDTTMNIASSMKEKGIGAVNTAIYQGMILGMCTEPIAKVYERVEKIFKVIYALEKGNYLFITHGFLMSVIEIFIKRSGAVYSPITIGELEATQNSKYLSGFSTDRDLSKIEFI